MEAMVNVTSVTAPTITPQDTAGLEAVGSLLVCTVTESVAALAMPSVQPCSVTVMAVQHVSYSEEYETSKTMEVPPGVLGVMLSGGPIDTEAVGGTEVSKKPEG